MKFSASQVFGGVCIIAGIIVVLTRVFCWLFTDRFMPLDWGGRTLIITGASLFGACGIGELVNKRFNKDENRS